MSKEVRPVKFCPLSLLFVICLFWFCYFRRFRHSERGIKSLRLEVTSIMVCTKSHALIPVLLTYLTFSAFAWTDLADLDDPFDSTFVKYKSGHGMATPELMEAHNDDNVVDINSVSLSLSL